MRGYFAIGIDGVSKAGNIGNLMRTAHAFGAAFTFALLPDINEQREARWGRNRTDTSKSEKQIPYFEYHSLAEMKLPKGCQLVAVEFTENATNLPSFRHPINAAYILGSERYSISQVVLEKCQHVIKIPTKFSLNVATAGAIVMYDRMTSMGKFDERPVMAGGKPIAQPKHVRGNPRRRTEE